MDNLSLMAITISVGFVVDDAIVVIENIYRFIEHGEPPMQAALKGARQIGFTVISMSTSLVAVFIPLLFMGGLIGRLFHEFAVTLSLAILVSGVISLTLTPMLCSRFLKPESAYGPPGRFSPGQRRRLQLGAWAFTRAVSGGCCAISISCCWWRSSRSSPPSGFTSSCPRDFFRSRTPA